MKVGAEAAKGGLKQDKYKTLFINDTIGLHDKQHVVMLKSCGLGGHLAGISAIKDARKKVNSLVHQLNAWVMSSCDLMSAVVNKTKFIANSVFHIRKIFSLLKLCGIM